MARRIRLDNWLWDPNTLELRNGSSVVTLEPRVARLLEYMVAHPGELLSRDQLVDAVWDGRIVSDEAVRTAVFSLRQALAAGGSGSYIRTVHKKGYVATFPQPVPQDLEAFQDPSGPSSSTISRDSPVTPSMAHGGVGPVRVHTSRRRAFVLGIIVFVALGAVVLTQFEVLRERESSSKHTEVAGGAPATIAILPFISLSEAADGQLLADGLTEELFGTLERNRELRVTDRRSAFQFKEKERDARELGGRLGVRYVLEGDIRRDQEQVQVQATLFDSETGAQLWTETYDRKFTDWFALQQDIAVDVASAVERTLQREVRTLARRGVVVNSKAQLELLRARQLLITRSVEDAERAIEHLQRALTLDPNYVLAYARLADAILIQAESTTGIKAARQAVAPLLEKALALDPDLGEAYALRSMLTDDAAQAERDLRRGLELNPSYARGYEMLANLTLASLAQADVALDSIDRAIALDPLTPGNFHTKAQLMMAQGNWPEVIKLERRTLELSPDFRAAILQLAVIHAVVGNYAEAIDYAERAVELDPRAVPLRDHLIFLYVEVGDLESARGVSATPGVSDHLLVLWAGGKIREAADILDGEVIARLAQSHPEIVSQIVLLQALSDRDYTRALQMLSGVLPFNESLPAAAMGWWPYAYANVVQLLDANGDRSAAARLREQINERMSTIEARFPPYHLIRLQVQAVLFAHDGRVDEACAALERAYTPAPRLYTWMVLGNPAFDDMRSAPCFQSLVSRIDAHVAAERERIDTMRREDRIPDRSRNQLKTGAIPRLEPAGSRSDSSAGP